MSRGTVAALLVLALLALGAGRAALGLLPPPPPFEPPAPVRLASPAHRPDPAVWGCDPWYENLNNSISYWLDHNHLEMTSLITVRYLPSYKEGYSGAALMMRFSFDPHEPGLNNPPWILPEYNLHAYADAFLELVVDEGRPSETTLKLSATPYHRSGFFAERALEPSGPEGAAGLVTRGDWHELKLYAGQGELKAFLDGRPFARVASALPLRRIALRPGLEHVMVDRLKISDGPGQVLMDEEFHTPVYKAPPPPAVGPGLFFSLAAATLLAAALLLALLLARIAGRRGDVPATAAAFLLPLGAAGLLAGPLSPLTFWGLLAAGLITAWTVFLLRLRIAQRRGDEGVRRRAAAAGLILFLIPVWPLFIHFLGEANLLRDVFIETVLWGALFAGALGLVYANLLLRGGRAANLASLLIVVVGLLCLETLARRGRWAEEPPVPRNVDAYELLGRGQEIKEGRFRGRTYSKEKPPGTLRVACLGGSSTYGYPFEDPEIPYPARLERLLNEHLSPETGLHYQVINGGLLGHTTFLMRMMYEKVLEPYRPDVLTVYAGYNDGTFGKYFQGYEGLPDATAWREILSSRRRLTGLKSRLSKIRLYRILKRRLLELRYGAHGLIVPRCSPEDARENLVELVRVAVDHGTRVVLMYEANKNTRPLEEELASNGYFQALREAGRETGAWVVDSVTPLREKAARPLYVDFIHLSPEGHRALAEILYGPVSSLLSGAPQSAAAP